MKRRWVSICQEAAGKRPSQEDLAEPKSDLQLVGLSTLAGSDSCKGTSPGLPEGTAPGTALAALFEHVAESHLIQPTFILDYPLEVSPLAKQKLEDPNFVERFELYIGRNWNSPTPSASSTTRRTTRPLRVSTTPPGEGDLTAHAIDEDYIRALSYGLPPTAGRHLY